VNTASSASAAILATNLFGNAGMGVAVGSMTFLLLVFGEITPKSIAVAHSEWISLSVAPFLSLLIWIMTPFIWVFDAITKTIMAILGIHGDTRLITRKELEMAIKAGESEEIIEKKERELLESVLGLNAITAKEVMTPRTKMFALETKQTIKDVVRKVVKLPYSRIPLFKGTKDNIVGILHVKEMLKALARNKPHPPLMRLAEDPFFVPDSMPIQTLFEEFQERHQHMAIVVDEYGGVAGIVTLEDLIEELVGEIIDETDITPETIMRINKSTIIVHGDTEIDDINNFMNINLPTKHVTINGLVEELAKNVPRKGKKINLAPRLTAEVLESSKKKVKKLRISKY
jgi:CBS domain containing-hemolysin-like protein